MADMVTQKDIGSLVTARLGSGFAQATAGGAGNAAAVQGVALQRSTLGLPRNALLCLAWTATLAATRTLSIGTVLVQDSADGTTWSPYQTFADPGVVATGPSGGGTLTGAVPLKLQLSGSRDYVRVLFTPTLSAAAADTATVVAVLALAGFGRLPAPL